MSSPSTRPYLVRAIHEWALDNGLTPQIAVNAGFPGVQVPPAHVQDGQIILNIHPQSVRSLVLGNEQITFLARFGGKSEAVRIPVQAVLAVYVRENGAGIQFPPEQDDLPPPSTDTTGGSGTSTAGRKGGHLKIVK